MFNKQLKEDIKEYKYMVVNLDRRIMDLYKINAALQKQIKLLNEMNGVAPK